MPATSIAPDEVVEIPLFIDDGAGEALRADALRYLAEWLEYHHLRRGGASLRGQPLPIAADFAYRLLAHDPDRLTFARVFKYTYHLQLNDLRTYLIRHLAQAIDATRAPGAVPRPAGATPQQVAALLGYSSRHREVDGDMLQMVTAQRAPVNVRALWIQRPGPERVRVNARPSLR